MFILESEFLRNLKFSDALSISWWANDFIYEYKYLLNIFWYYIADRPFAFGVFSNKYDFSKLNCFEIIP